MECFVTRSFSRLISLLCRVIIESILKFYSTIAYTIKTVLKQFLFACYGTTMGKYVE